MQMILRRLRIAIGCGMRRKGIHLESFHDKSPVTHLLAAGAPSFRSVGVSVNSCVLSHLAPSPPPPLPASCPPSRSCAGNQPAPSTQTQPMMQRLSYPLGMHGEVRGVRRKGGARRWQDENVYIIRGKERNWKWEKREYRENEVGNEGGTRERKINRTTSW